MRGSVRRYCLCKDADGKLLEASCPKLRSTKHGEWRYRDRLLTSGGRRQLQRLGFPTMTAGEKFQKAVHQLVDLAAADERVEARIGDLIFERTKRGGQLPEVEEIRRRLGAGLDVSAPSQTVLQFGESWLAGKRKLKPSARRLYDQHLGHYIFPILGDIPVARLRVEQIVGMFDTIEEWNQEIAQAREDGRRPHLPGDVRRRSGVVGLSTQHRILSTLSNMLNDALRPPRRLIDFNPCLGVDLPPADLRETLVYSPEQVGIFLASTADDYELGLLFRIVLLRGPRRGEVVGLPWTSFDSTYEHARISQTILQLGGKIVFDTPKTRKGHRTIAFDPETARQVKQHRKRQRAQRIALGEVYQDHGLVFARPDGTPWPPDLVSRRFREAAAAAGLPVIGIHAGRHTAASLALVAGIETKLVSDQLGHSTTRITEDLYQHVLMASHDRAAQLVVDLIPEPKRAKKTGA